MPEQAQLDHLVERLQRRDQLAEQQFWERFGPALQRLAAKHIARPLRSRIEPEEVVQSVCRTFFRRLYEGKLELQDSQQLLSLLCVVTLNKVRKKLRSVQTQKRDPSREVRHSGPETSGFDPVGREPSPAEEAEFDEALAKLMASFSEQERQVIELKLQDQPNEAIAGTLRCSDRWVRHILKRIRDRLAATGEE